MEALVRKEREASGSISRNDPCPCGTGKKQAVLSEALPVISNFENESGFFFRTQTLESICLLYKS